MLKLILENTSCIVDCDDSNLLTLLDNELALKESGYLFNPAYKNGSWDGKIRFFDTKTKTFPAGLLNVVTDLLNDLNIPVHITDNRIQYDDIIVPRSIDLYEPDLPEGVITLRDYQRDAVAAAITNKRGIINVATNGGKTECASGIIKTLLPHLKPSERILFVTHSKEIASQSAARISKRLGIKVGIIGDGEWDEQQVTVIMIPTVSRNLKVPKADITYRKEFKPMKFLSDFLTPLLNEKHVKLLDLSKKALKVLESQRGKKRDQAAIDMLTYIITEGKTENGCQKLFLDMKKQLSAYEKKELKKLHVKRDRAVKLLESAVCFIGDEFHRSSSTSWYDTLSLCTNAVFRIGLTGTVDKDDKILQYRLYGLTGQILTKISNEFLIGRGISAKPVIHLSTVSEPNIKDLDFQPAYQLGIVDNKHRNQIIVEQVTEKYKGGKGCLIIVNHKKHGDNIKDLLQRNGVECEFTHGSFDNRQGVLDDMKSGKLKVLIATAIMDEGVDISGINCLWMAAGGKSFRQVLQRIGRGLRKKEDGSGLEVYDFLDYTNKYLTKHTKQRVTYYKDEGFELKRMD